ncbi:cytochrome b [Erythrobacter alti]|uniref:cytochrome b n=1 Tax=Erythrobacter alti TaxID=1896145 RepID=UPI0030F3D048
MTDAKRYSGVAMALHWVIAIAVIVNWRIAEAAENEASREAASAVMANHKALGITILVLTLMRLGWRLTHRPPALSRTYAPWERILARSVHIIFYVMLIGLPLGGWLASSYFGQGVNVFGLFTLPALSVSENPDTGKAIFDLHQNGGKIMLILVGLHILGVLKHMFIDKDGNLWKMLPVGKPRR